MNKKNLFLEKAKELEFKMEYHKKEYTKYKSIYDQICGMDSSDIEESLAKTKRPYKKKLKRMGYKTVVFQILEKSQFPMGTKALLTAYNEVSQLECSMANFSAALASLMPKTIKRVVFPEGMSASAHYGLVNWFNDKELKQEYMDNLEKNSPETFIKIDSL